MSTSRPSIPSELERDLMLESGYRCALCKATSPLQIDHIVEWSKVNEHKFENMIVLCANCHARKTNTNNPRHINRVSLRKLKSNLTMMNGRYSDLEKRVISFFQEMSLNDNSKVPAIIIPERMIILVIYLINDGLVSHKIYRSGITQTADDGTVLRDDSLKLTLTAAGKKFIEQLAAPVEA